MPRRPLPIGGHGEISYRTLGPRKVQAKCKVRDADGAIRKVAREGTSKSAARDALLAAIAERTGFTGSVTTGETTVKVAGERWLAEVERQVATGARSPNTPRLYHSAFANHVVPAVGALRLREATTPRLDAFLVGMQEHHGSAITKTARTVLNGLLGYAVRQGAIRLNPMREVSRIHGGPKRVPRALTQAERDDWISKMEADEVAMWRDIPDLTRFMLATGCRIGECLAVTFAEVDVDAKTVEINWTIMRVAGQGLRRSSTKTAAGERTLRLPGWAVDMLIRRGDRHGWTGPVFPVPGWRGKAREHGAWRDLSNTSRDIREARARAGYGWVTSHVFRKTVATVLDEAGLTAREIADQLGHSRVSITQDVYMGRKAVDAGSAIALEEMWGSSE